MNRGYAQVLIKLDESATFAQALLAQMGELPADNRDFYLIELKIDEFKPEYTRKLNFYINVAGEQLRQAYQNATSGLLLCKSANRVIAEYSLKDSCKPIGMTTYRLLPKEERFVELLNRKLT